MVKKANFAKNAAKWKKAQGSAEVVAANKLECPGGDCREGSPLENVFVNVLNLKTLPKAGDLGGNEFAEWSRKDYREEWERMVNPFIYSDYGEGMQNIPSQADYDKFRGEFMQTHPDLFVPTIKGMGGEGRFKLTPENQYDIAMKAYYAARNPGMKRVGTPYLKASGRDPQNLGFEDVVRDFSSAGWENAANWMYAELADTLLSLLKSDGSPLNLGSGGSAQPVHYALKPLGFARLETSLAGTTVAGYARLSGSSTLEGTALFKAIKENLVLSEAGVGLSKPANRRGRTGFT